MRQVVVDTETTGLEPSQGHRIIEIGCVELIDRRHTSRHFHQYIRPDREIDDGALQVHGITQDFLADKPPFEDVADDLMAFLDGAELIIHNAPFDVGFLNFELSQSGSRFRNLEDHCTVVDTLALARELHPGQKNSLDALCKRYQIDNSQRELHGALLDAQLLADVYLAMTGGQATLDLSARPPAVEFGATRRHGESRSRRLRVLRADGDESAAHERMLDRLDRESGASVWRRIEGGGAGG
ncbi:MAG: DNA polymerase III subunit epsilon [Gammaproteobacteria bacterium]|nr:DNA polymerase III subunit epsilon [Gammaproteobacteria bacterium]